MPLHNGVRSDENQGALPSRPEAPQHDPEESVGIGETWTRVTSRQNRQLLPQSQVFQEKMMASAKRPREQNKEKPQQSGHEWLIPNKAQ